MIQPTRRKDSLAFVVAGLFLLLATPSSMNANGNKGGNHKPGGNAEIPVTIAFDEGPDKEIVSDTGTFYLDEIDGVEAFIGKRGNLIFQSKPDAVRPVIRLSIPAGRTCEASSRSAPPSMGV